ncbi:aspartyl protease family protein At5g10770-like [Miscanthus floridulus]|uniref:aspartyl protease family protein At5g10770-like n=1 Tax=Miscanthus floridulus TaxID=154761 RepID=UPI00345A0DAF
MLLCVLLLCSYCLIALGGNERGFVVVPTSTSSPSNPAACSPAPQVTSDPNRASMPLAHRHGPCAPASVAATNRPSRAEMLGRDRARRNHILRKASGRRITLSDVGVSIPTSLGAAVDSLQYVVTLGFGTPAVSQVLLIDTGSDLSWVQCQPCSSSRCYPQKDRLFDPSASSSYAPIPCDSKACRDLDPVTYANGCTNSSGTSLCQYGIQYANGDITVGVYSTETLTLSPQVSVKNFSFGCGLVQRGTFDLFDGLLGLGGAPESLVSQTAETYGGAFSYCLPAGNSTTGFLALGAPSNNTAGFLFTSLHSVPKEPTFYLVNLTGISVGGTQLDIQPTVFSGGMIIDSGTPDVARVVVGHGSAGALVEICQTGDSVSQTAAAGALRNLSAVPEVRQALVDEGVVRVMVGLLDRGAARRPWRRRYTIAATLPLKQLSDVHGWDPSRNRCRSLRCKPRCSSLGKES